MTASGKALEVTVVEAPEELCADLQAPSASLAGRFPIVVVAMEQCTDEDRAVVEPLRPATDLSVMLDGRYADFTGEYGLRLEKIILTALRAAMAAGRP